MQKVQITLIGLSFDKILQSLNMSNFNKFLVLLFIMSLSCSETNNVVKQLILKIFGVKIRGQILEKNGLINYYQKYLKRLMLTAGW
jgi:hypothetical protein